MNKAIKEFDWDTCFDSDDIDEICQNWTSTFLNFARRFIPNKDIVIRQHDTPWFNSDLRKLKKNKDRLHHKAKTTNSLNDWATFRAVRNTYTTALREAKAQHKEKLATSLHGTQNINPKNWWHIAKSFMGKTKSSSIPPMIDGNKTYFDSKDKANAFNKAFLSFSDIDDSKTQLPEFSYKTDSRLEDIQTTEQEVQDILKSLDISKATGPDGISARMLKETSSTITPSLTKLIKLSLQHKKVPSLWKEANVIPIHKKDSKSEFSNYRPVSLLSIPSKVCEKVIFKHLYNYIKDHNLITLHQSGFTPGDSTIHQLLYMYDFFCKALDEKKDVQIVFCDQSKAFDRVWHKGLIHKLKSFGIEGPLLEWFSDYVTNRKQKVQLEGSHSEHGTIAAGVPQGSILGPLLFLIHINDITENISSDIKLFADDTSLYITIDKDNQIEKTRQLNEDLQTINQWAKTWLVTFNPQKTKTLFISFKTQPTILPLTFDGHNLDSVSHHKHLGLILNNNLSWKDHIDSVTSKANTKLNVLAHLKHILDRKTLRTLYESFIRPSLEYGNIIYCNCTDGEKDEIEKIQRRAARIISGGTISTSVRLLYEELALETLETRQNRQMLTAFHKIINNNCPSYLYDIRPKPPNRQIYNLRRQHDVTLPKCRLSTYQNSFFPTAAKKWNLLPDELKQIHDIDDFKFQLEQSIPTENPLYLIGNRQTNIIMAKLRMNNSELKADMYKINISDTEQCDCGHAKESALHFFLECPIYTLPRAALHQTFQNLTNRAPFTLRTLLFGSQNLSKEENKTIYNATINFVQDSQRFTKK